MEDLMAERTLVKLRAGRRDIAVYNEACAFYLTSENLAGVAPSEELLDEPEKWIRDGIFLPVELMQDDPFLCRVVVGRLRDDERQEWVGKLQWKLRIPDGVLVVAAGCEYVMGEFDPEDDYWDEFVHFIEVPPGDYKVTVYMYLPGINGEWVLECAGRDEQLGTWFRRSRPGQEMPPWLAFQAASDYDTDPGHEEEWQEADFDALHEAAEQNQCLGFLFHLEPLAAWDELTQMPALDHGLFHATEVQKPELFPLGIPGDEIVDPAKERADSYVPPPLVAVDVWSKLKDVDLTLVEGGPVALAAELLWQVHRLAMYCNDNVDGGLSITFPQGSTPTVEWSTDEDIVVSQTGQTIRIGFPETGERWLLARGLRDLGAQLAAAPDGTQIEALFIDDEGSELGRQRYRGCVREGIWYIDHTAPQVSGQRLGEALSLVQAAREENGIQARSEEEADDIIETVRKDPMFELVVVNRVELKLIPTESYAYDELAAAFFRVRFADVWPCKGPEQVERRRLFEAGKRVAASVTSHVYELAKEDEVVFVGSFTRFFQANISVVDDQALAEIDEVFQELELTHLGDLVAEQFGGIILRAYAHVRLPVYVSTMLGVGGIATDLYTVFDDGASQTTTTTIGQRDDPSKKTYKACQPEAEPAELLVLHQQLLDQHQQQGRAAQPIEATIAGFAAAVDEFLVRYYS
jgi:hypothetical protein